ncbi:MAG: hypothetical protein M3Z03_03815 [Actinomycetota bacterium]|nr:hypothetical protein [Actinomycetota bacterium]
MGGEQLEGDERRRSVAGFGTALGAAAVLRLVSVVGKGPFVYVDSIDYETLDFSGRSRRPWATPLLYEVVRDPQLRVVAQGVIGVVCWSVLALEVTRHVQDRRIQWALLLGVLGLSLTTTITNWDTTMLSEPLALSLTTLLIAALLRLAREPDRRAALLVGAALVPWIFTRQNNLVPGVLLATTLAVVAVVAWRRRHDRRRILAGLAGAAFVILALAAGSYSRNTEIVHHNLASVMGGRVLLDDSDARWFVAHGMPDQALDRLSFPASGDQMLGIRSFRDWVEDEGVATYARFLLTHPIEAVRRPAEALVSERPPTFEPQRADDAMLGGIVYGAAREVLPKPVEDLFAAPAGTGTIVFLVVVALAATLDAARQRGPSPQWLAPFLLLALQWPALTVVWHASTGELERLGLVSLVGCWIGALLLLGVVVDARIRPAATDPPRQTTMG